MKITIDTKEDSHEDIKKIVKMLEALLDGHVSAPLNMFGDAPSPDSSGSGGTDLFSLFNDDKSSQSSSGTNEVKKDDNKEDMPEIIVY